MGLVQKSLQIKPEDQPLPPDCIFVKDFITKEEHDTLLKKIDSQPWNNVPESLELQRRTQHYGYAYNYKQKTIDEKNRLGPLPEWLSSVTERIIEKGLIAEKHFDQAIVNEYMPGQGISPHVDSFVFGEPIVSLSLGSYCVMRFKPFSPQIQGEKGQENSRALPLPSFDVLLPPQSLIVLRGASRNSYTHEIPARKTDVWDSKKFVRTRRCSITYRHIV